MIEAGGLLQLTMQQIIDFILELDKLKGVNAQSPSAGS
jgi:hypothetical protein